MSPCVEDRKRRIIDIINERGRVNVNELSRMFEVSGATIRIDLSCLETKGVLERVYGGAVRRYKTYSGMDFLQSTDTNKMEKLLIAEKVANVVKDNETVMLNSGTTALYAFRALVKHKNLNIITNSITIAAEAANMKSFNVTLLGGIVDTQHQFTYGTDAQKQICNYHVDKLILSVDGVSCSAGLSTYFYQETELLRRMIKQASYVVIAADYTKLGRNAFVRFSPLSAIDLLVTNKNVPENELAVLRKVGVDIELV